MRLSGFTAGLEDLWGRSVELGEALRYAHDNGWTINKHADPIEGDCYGIDPDRASVIVEEDGAYLLWLERRP